MSESKFKTMRHIEAVRNYLDLAAQNLMDRAKKHDQSKLESPEVEIFEEYTPKLRGCIYGSEEYIAMCREMKVAINHHQANNDHHPEYFANGINDMHMLQLLEMIIDWKVSGLRSNTGDINKSLDINQKRFDYSDELKGLLKRIIDFLDAQKPYHKAEES